MPPAAIPPTRNDHASWARLWSLARGAWGGRATAVLAERLGIARTTLAEYCSGARHGDWNALIRALRISAQENPDEVPALVGALVGELLDAEGTWLPDRAAQDLGDLTDEVADVTIASARLVQAARRGASPEELDALARELVREAHEAGAVARSARG